MIKQLIKNRLTSVLCGIVGRGKGGSVKKAGKGKIIAFSILYLYLVIFFASFSATMSVTLGKALIPIGASWLYFSIFIIASVTVSFILSIFETKTELFECKDNELLLSMPINPRDIVLSRISVVLVYNYTVQAIVMLPCIVVYGIISHDIVGILGLTLVSLLLPLFSTSLASGVGYIIARISKRFRKNSFVTVGITVVFLIAYFYGYSYLMEGINNIATGGALNITKESAPVLYAIGASALLKPLNFIITLTVSVFSAILAFCIIAKNYISVVTDNRGAKKAVYKGEKASQRKAVYALISKEFSKFTSSALYMLNSGLGVVFEIILGVVAIINRREIMALVSMLTDGTGISASEFISPIMIAAIFLLSSMNMMSASALSLEGKNLWIIKSMPVKDRDIMIAKSTPHIIISTIPSLITAMLLMIAVSAPVKYWIFFLLTPLAANVFSAFMGLVINVQFPKFDYENEAQPIKQSLPVFLVLMIQSLLGILIVIGNFALSTIGFSMLAAILTFVFFLTLAILFAFILFGPSARKYSTYDS